MARGIYYADVINTVSERYAREILTPEYGEKLDPILRDRQERLFGILNGIDVERLNPATDEHIAQNFDLESLHLKAANKEALQREGGLAVDPYVPLIGMISRLTDQKGFDLIAEIIEPALNNLSFQFVLLGTGEQQYHDIFADLSRRHPDRMAVFLTFNTPLAQKIYAGSDIFLMPSRFEPCGLGQMIAMRYGSVPLVRATGGLADTVENYEPSGGIGTGFSFEEYSGMALYTALVRALETHRHKGAWTELVRRGMRTDYSWTASARKYVELYRRALALSKN
jgi:starch synthase